MRWTIALTVALLAVLPFAPAEGLGQGKKKKGMTEGVKASPQEYAQLQNVKELMGKLGFADDKAVSLRVEYSHMVPNPAFKPGGMPKGGKGGGADLNRLYQEIIRDQAEIARAKNPIERQRKMQELQRDMQKLQMAIAKASGKGGGAPQKGGNMNGPFKLVTENKEFDLDLVDNVIVRWLNPPFEYDDKGEAKKYTKEELAKMKGKDAKLPGYEAKLDSLLPGQTVKVYLKAPVKGASKKNLLDEAEGNPGAGSRPTVAMIVILEESNLPVAPPKKKGKK